MAKKIDGMLQYNCGIDVEQFFIIYVPFTIIKLSQENSLTRQGNGPRPRELCVRFDASDDGPSSSFGGVRRLRSP